MEAKLDILTRSAVLTRAVADHLKDSIVYTDDGAGEAAFANYGMRLLQGAKPVMLIQLQNLSMQDAHAAAFLHGSPVTKIVFALHQLLTTAFNAVVNALQAVKEGSAPTDNESAQPTELKVWVQHFPLHVCPVTSNIFVLPASSAVSTASFRGSLAGYADGGGGSQGHLAAHANDSHEASDDIQQAALRLLAHSLIGFAAQQDLRLDTFALGPASRSLGDEICALPVPYGPGGSQPSSVASLLLVDRHMDLLTPALHQNHVLDCIFERLPSRQHAASSTTTAQQTPRQRPSAHAGHPQGAASMSVEQSIMAIPEATAENPVQGVSEGQHAVNTKDEQRHNSPEAMSLDDPSADHRQASPTPRKNRSGACEPYSLRSADVLVPMCSPEQKDEQQFRGLEGSVLGSGQVREWLQFLTGREPKDALLYLRKWLREAARKEDVQLNNTRSKKTDEAAVLQEISALSNALAAKPTGMLRQRAILQLAYAAVHAMHKDVSCSWDAVHQQEQELAASAAQGSEILANAVADMWRTQHSNTASERLQLQDMMLLTCIGYWLAAEASTLGPQDVHSKDFTPWLPDEESALKDAMVDAFLQAEAEDLFRLSWMQSLAGRLGVLQKQLQQMQATQDDSSPRIDALAEEESGEETTDELAPTSSTAHQQQKLQATPGDNAETASDTSHFSTDLHRGWQQIKLDMQSAVEQQLVQIGHAAALQARTQLRMGPLAEGSLPGTAEQGVDRIRVPLIHTLTKAVLQHQHIPGLYHASASLRGLLKSGLGRIGLLQPKQPHPADHKTVIVFVLGGICMAELRAVQQTVSSVQGADGLPVQMLAGGTTLTRPADIYSNLF